MAVSAILRRTENRVAWLEFNRPPVNAFTRPMVEEVRAGIAATLAAIRCAITLGGVMRFEESMAMELEAVERLADTPDFAAGVDAHLNKRAPKWSGG
ncbi:MAG: hypothetical protein FJX20_10630 [Alphaproteobacteria bacterium]|nr:hypothetical protein [Alphaproteobacteria bacterium]